MFSGKWLEERAQDVYTKINYQYIERASRERKGNGMHYRAFGNTGVAVSALGFGCMRFPTQDGKIWEEKAIAMLREAIDAGVNYIDTAYFYHDGQSEELVGKALRDGYREKVNVATKMPPWHIESPEDFDRIFEDQRRKLGVDCIDFYLLHALGRDTWENKVLKFDLLSKVEKLKAEGKIRFMGFSFHDDFEAFRMMVDACDHWDFCQLQLNYIDVNNQAGIRGLEYAAARGMGVIVMEPLLGGKLADPPAGVKAVLPPERTPVEWALDFLWDRPEVSLLLSGMSTPQQVTDNLLYADRSAVGMLTPEQREMFVRAKTVYDTMALVPCTKCSYCMPCPMGVNIPGVFEAYNRSAVSMDEAKPLYAALDGHTGEQCIACGQCQQVCPQKIAISEVLPKAHAVFQQD